MCSGLVKMFRINDIAGCFEPAFGKLVSIKTPLIVLGGVSGVGKTSVSWLLRQRQPTLHFIKTTTTRPPRGIKSEDIHYRFVAQETFNTWQAAREFLCFTVWAGNGQGYGLAKSELPTADAPYLRLFASTYFGAALKAQSPHKVLHLWLACSDSGVLERRLRHRLASDDSELERRCSTAVAEQAYVLQHKKQLLTQNKIDRVIDTAYRSVEEVSQVVEEEIARFLWAANFSPAEAKPNWRMR